MDALQQVQLQGRLRTLVQEHADLSAAILALEHSGAGDQLQIRRLKKKEAVVERPYFKNRRLADPRHYRLNSPRNEKFRCHHHGQPVGLVNHEACR